MPKRLRDLVAPFGHDCSCGWQRHAHALVACQSPAPPGWPSPAHPRPRCRYVVSATACDSDRGPSGGEGLSGCEPYDVTCVLQEPQLGTGHAVAQAEPILADFQGDVLVLYGDVPLLQSTTLRTLWDVHRRQQATVTVVTAFLDNPTGYGRILRDASGRITRVL